MTAPTTELLPTNYTIRAPQEADATAIRLLIEAVDDAEFGVHDSWTEADIIADWQGADGGTEAWVIQAPDGRIVAYLSTSDFGHGQLNADGYVHPDFRERGIGTAIIQITEACARQWIDTAPEGARVSLTNGIAGESLASRTLLERHGYTPKRYYWRMRIDMEHAPAEPQWPEGVTVRPFVVGQDERAVFEAVEEAFSDHWGHTPRSFETWCERAMRDGFDPSLWFLAEENGELAGFSLCRMAPEVGWLNTLGVRRPWRKRGLGMALLKQTFGEFYRRGQHAVVLGVDAQNLTGAVRLYEQAGMHVSMRFATYEKELRAGTDLAVRALAE